MGYPYCPFVARPFIEYIEERREDNPKFGVRIHGGENVPFADAGVGAYRHFIAHMYIVFRCLRFLYRKLGYGIRIGHGIAFARILDDSTSKLTHRKSSVLLAEMRDHAKHILPKIAFEVNITSNAYLLGPALRAGNYEKAIRLDSLRELGVPIILGTDDDGVWPIDRCTNPSGHPMHISLVAEYCRAIDSKLIELNDLEVALTDAKEFCFFSIDDICVSPKKRHGWAVLPDDDKSSFTIIFHPDVIKAIMQKYDHNRQTHTRCYHHYLALYPIGFRTFSNNEQHWIAKCDILSRFVFFSYYIHYTDEPHTTRNAYRKEYDSIFVNGPSFEQIYDIWKTFRATFMLATSTTTVHHIEGPENLVFVSESSHPDHQQLQCLLEYLSTSTLSPNRSIRVFIQNVSHSGTAHTFTTELRPHHSEKMSVSVFSTRDKDKYVSFASGNVEFNVNSKPTRRTNHLDEDEEHLLYVICPNASAATAYLHCIGKMLANVNQQQAWNGINEEEEEMPMLVFDLDEGIQK